MAGFLKDHKPKLIIIMGDYLEEFVGWIGGVGGIDIVILRWFGVLYLVEWNANLVRGVDDAVGGGVESNGPLTAESKLVCGDEEAP